MISTCPTAADGGYDLEVREGWVEFFSMLPDRARILDVGTGNGVVAQIAVQTAAELGRTWDVHATDLALIDPVLHVPDGARRLAGITFHPGVATEQLPFEAEHFDAVSGHYALEYTQTASALAEIHRVLKPGSNAQFIIHSVDSVLVHAARRSLQEAELVLGETRIFRRLHRLVTMEEVTPGTTETITAELRAAIQAVKQGIQQAEPSGAGGVLSIALDAVHKLLIARKEMGPQAAGLEVDRAEGELRASALRLHDLMTHARTLAQMDTIEQEAATAGFSLIERMPQFHAGNNLVGWQLLMHRA
ncbi:MAG: class I SAM-dependent methyltransferase [Pseudomonadota bacterium]